MEHPVGPPEGENERRKARHRWRESWKDCCSKERHAIDLMAHLWERLPRLDTPLGLLARNLTEDYMPPRDSVPHPRGEDLLPMDLEAIDGYLQEDTDLKMALKLVVTSLNYLWMGGRESSKYRPNRSQPLTKAQCMAVDHLVERLSDLAEVEASCADHATARSQLVDSKFDYGGEPIMQMEDLVADKVIPVWPAVGSAAVQDIIEYLPIALQEKLADPRRCLLPVWEWPQRPPRSKVRASQEEWEKIVTAAAARNLMVPVPAEEVFRDHQGEMVLNGAAAVRKLKTVGGESKVMQRFISNFIPTNAYQAHLEGGDQDLPYLGQLTLLEQEDDECWVIDSEDFTSCYNLFRLPPVWRKFMCFEKPVDARIFGGPPGEVTYAAMNVVPMGWLNAVALVQSAVRTLVFEESAVPEASEVSKRKPIPDDDDLTVIYLDSYDELRKMDRHCAEAIQSVSSPRHIRFKHMCNSKGLSLNTGKQLVSALRGSLQGGELQGDKGWYKLAGDKQVNLLSLGACLLGLPLWHEFDLRHFIGKAVFGMCFRRPLLSTFQNIFPILNELVAAKEPLPPRANGLDEVILTMALVPLMGSDLKAKLEDTIYCSDASPSGGGVAVATNFMPEFLTESHDGSQCWVCGHDLSDEYKFPCSAGCQVALCGIECLLRHRRGECLPAQACKRKDWPLPRFGERFAGKNARLTEAVALVGGIDVQPPFDWYYGHDFFSLEGRAFLDKQMDDPLLAAEHWAPCCKLFTKARGRPIQLADGRTIPGPQPVRDHRHLMGFQSVSKDMKVRLRQSNQMALKSLKRLEMAGQNNLYESLEHPLRSWLWEFTLAKRLVRDRFRESRGSHCCFGGRREKWFQFLNNIPAMKDFIERDCPGHTDLLPYEVTQGADGRLHYDTEEESEYPWELCVQYARGLKQQLLNENRLQKIQHNQRVAWISAELAQSTERLALPHVNAAVAEEVAFWEESMRPGEEHVHLRQLMHSISYRGSEMRAYVTLTDESEERHEMPYPALKWKWRTLLSFPWKGESHINELEVCAVNVTIKHRHRSRRHFHRRWFQIVDSMVTRGALAKGRSPSGRINRLLRKSAAGLVIQNGYIVPLWTISRWNFSDKASRQFDAA